MKTKQTKQTKATLFPETTIAQAYLEGAFSADFVKSTSDKGKTFDLFAFAANGEYADSFVEGLTAKQVQQIMELFHDLVLTSRIVRNG